MVITRTPYRISFFGGGTDYPAWWRQHGGEVLGTTIDKYCYISVRSLPPFFKHKHRIVYSLIENVQTIGEINHPVVREAFNQLKVQGGLEVHHDGDLPARSGMGSSSSFAVGLLNALHVLRGEFISKQDLAKEAIHLEQELIKENVGSQDQIHTAHGGFNRVVFCPNGDHVIEPVIVPPARKEALEKHLLLFYTGISRFASEIAKTQIGNFSNREIELKEMAQMVPEALSILCNSSTDIREFGKLLNQGWQRKRTLSNSVSNPAIDELYQKAIDCGGIGGKVLGAGGGGFLLVFAEPSHHQAVINGLDGLLHVPFQFENSGSRVVVYEPSLQPS